MLLKSVKELRKAFKFFYRGNTSGERLEHKSAMKHLRASYNKAS